MSPEEGFIRVDETSTVFIRCFNPNACRLPTIDEKLGACSDNYSGFMCAECEDGYWRRESK